MKIANPIAVIGEDKACEFLRKKGYKIIERNFRKGYGEIDIIAVKDKVLVFVEVKTKRGVAFGTPEEMFTKGKAERVKRMASVYLEGREFNCRIDMVAIVLGESDQPLRITHYPNVVMW